MRIFWSSVDEQKRYMCGAACRKNRQKTPKKERLHYILSASDLQRKFFTCFPYILSLYFKLFHIYQAMKAVSSCCHILPNSASRYGIFLSKNCDFFRKMQFSYHRLCRYSFCCRCVTHISDTERIIIMHSYTIEPNSNACPSVCLISIASFSPFRSCFFQKGAYNSPMHRREGDGSDHASVESREQVKARRQVSDTDHPGAGLSENR